MSELFYEDEHHALRATIENGKGYKASAAHLWPDMKPETRYAKLKHAVADQHGEHLRFSQVVELMKFNDRNDVLAYVCDETGYERPTKRKVEDERDELMRAWLHGLEVQKQIAARLERLSMSPLQKVA